MAAANSIRIVKQFNYRGALRNFSNRYHFGTYLPPDTAHWTTLANNIVAAEKLIYSSLATGGAKIIQAVGYAGGSEVPVFTLAYTTDGTATGLGTVASPGDTAALIRYATPDRSTKNHPIYCFNYYHAAVGATGPTTGDTFNPTQKALFQTYGNAWISGFSDGATTVNRSRPSGNLCTGAFVEPFLTHRDLPH
jgi:hypothetical protein